MISTSGFWTTRKIVGASVVGALAILIVVALAMTLSASRARAQGILCASQLRQIGLACAQYQEQFGSYPRSLGDLAAAPGVSAAQFICPADAPRTSPADVEMDRQGLAAWIDQNTSYTYCGPTLPGGIVAYENPGSHEAGLANVLLSDGAVDRLTAAELQRRLSAAPAAPALAPSVPTRAAQLAEGETGLRAPAAAGSSAARGGPTNRAPGAPAAAPPAPRPPLSSLPTITLPARLPVLLGEARKDFKTKLTRQITTADPVETPPANLFRIVKYDAPPGKMAAYLTPDPGDGAKHPAIIWITGGDCNSIGDVWSAAPADNDQTASAYRKAGIIMMFPSLRGGNGNPGFKEGFYGEVDDVLAAADYLAAQPYVDPSRIYLGGHSTGGTLALLVAECSNRFRAVFSFGPANDVTRYGADTVALPFDRSQPRELKLRTLDLWLASITTPTWVFEGLQSPSNASELFTMAKAPCSPKTQFCLVAGRNHFSVLSGTNQIIASKIISDTDAQPNIAFAAGDLPGLTPIKSREVSPSAGPITMAVAAQPARTLEVRVNIDRLLWEAGTDDAPGVDNYAGKYVQLRGTVNDVTTAMFPNLGLTDTLNGPASLYLTCFLAKDAAQLDLADELTPGQEVVVCGTAKPSPLRMQECTIIAVGPDPAIKISADQLCKEFVANPKDAQARYKDKILLVEGTVRQYLNPGNGIVLDGGDPAAGAVSLEAYLQTKALEVGQKTRVKAKFSRFGNNRITLEEGRVLRDPSATGAVTFTPEAGPAIQRTGASSSAATRPSGLERLGVRVGQNASAILGTQQGRPGRYGFPMAERMLGIRYDLTKGAGPPVLRTVSAFASKPLPIRGTEHIVQAREGYAVGGLIVDADSHVNAIRIVFVRIDGDRIVADDTYTSDWLGTPQTDKPTTLGANGQRVTGIVFYEDSRLNGIGLTFAPAR